MTLATAVAALLLGTAVVQPATTAAPVVQEWAGDPDRRAAARVVAVPERVVAVEAGVRDVAPRVVDVVRPVAGGTSITLGTDVLFAFGSARLPPGAGDLLAGVVARLRQVEPAAVLVEGHTDGIGDAGANQVLSEQRAAAVAAALAADAGGVRVEQRGAGETQPLRPETTPAGDDDPAARAANRRVTITLVR
ncbi:OmpA family protein [Kineococcus auxinigenes]|uniref:OmpA family protein n=1 Tax=unclassified Kineococcus TaxID=2621656 RepID=UPI003D7E30BD